MKSKYNFLSMVIILIVFCLSDIFNVPHIASKLNEEAEEILQEENEMELLSSLNVLSIEEPSMASTLERVNSLSDEQIVRMTEEEEISIFSANISSMENEGNEQNVITNDNNTLTHNEDIESDEDSDSTKEEVPVVETASIKEDPIKEVKESLYSNIGISKADSYVNIRAKANGDSKVLGKLYHGAAATILDTVDDWYQIESGNVKGYVKKEFLLTGLSDEDLIKQYGKLKVSIKTDGLNVRKSPDQSSERLTVVYLDETYPVLELQDEWVKVEIPDDHVVGYVKRELTELIVKFTYAVSIEEEQKLEAAKKQEKLEQKTTTTYRDGVSYTEDELKLLACLVHAEAGSESYEGKLAVANVVLNRVKSGKYPNTIEKVIYQSGQFSVASSGSLKKQLNNYKNFTSSSQKSSIKAAREALEGVNNIGSRLYFNSYKSAVKYGHDKKKSAIKIDTQLFW